MAVPRRLVDNFPMYQVLATTGTACLESIAAVNTRLYGQLTTQGRPAQELIDIRRAYELNCALYSGAFQADGRPFIAHTVSVASILAILGLPSNIVAAGLIHNVYGNADFGDGRFACATPQRRERVRRAVGDEIESCVHRFGELRLSSRFPEIRANIGTMIDRDRLLLTIELADILEKYADLGVLYFGDSRWVTRFVDAHEQDLLELAHQLDQPVLAEALSLAISRVRSSQVPTELANHPEHVYLYSLMPGSCMERPRITWTRALKRTTLWQFARRIVRRN